MPTLEGGWIPEPGPAGEFCSGKLGEFSQALRADSICGLERENVHTYCIREEKEQTLGRISRNLQRLQFSGYGVLTNKLYAGGGEQGERYLECKVRSGVGHGV